jgi:hypothetical protein
MPSFQNGAGPGKSMKFVDALNPFAPFLAQPVSRLYCTTSRLDIMYIKMYILPDLHECIPLFNSSIRFLTFYDLIFFFKLVKKILFLLFKPG